MRQPENEMFAAAIMIRVEDAIKPFTVSDTIPLEKQYEKLLTEHVKKKKHMWNRKQMYRNDLETYKARVWLESDRFD
ncbi:MAG: hypothetical protein CBC71_06115 [Rhodobacteraceae bacterium TMED111]|nr:hypothetical protein [Marinovum sp.]OUV41074.1 MAG: hypothetical protein CBC71_06115 [Rhodobacteraceae bacterium TMED111]|tara:strand:+ start:226 stop:456 length:231 start_codon:yes stop_codon:yes gene_type:complete